MQLSLPHYSTAKARTSSCIAVDAAVHEAGPDARQSRISQMMRNWHGWRGDCLRAPDAVNADHGAIATPRSSVVALQRSEIAHAHAARPRPTGTGVARTSISSGAHRL